MGRVSMKDESVEGESEKGEWQRVGRQCGG